SGNDTFDLRVGQITGTINGGAGDDLFNVAINGINRGTFINGGSGSDRLTVTGARDAAEVSYTPTTVGGEFVYEYSDGQYRLAYEAVETIQENTALTSLVINCSNTINTIDLGNQSVAFDDAGTVNFTGKR